MMRPRWRDALRREDRVERSVHFDGVGSRVLGVEIEGRDSQVTQWLGQIGESDAAAGPGLERAADIAFLDDMREPLVQGRRGRRGIGTPTVVAETDVAREKVGVHVVQRSDHAARDLEELCGRRVGLHLGAVLGSRGSPVDPLVGVERIVLGIRRPEHVEHADRIGRAQPRCRVDGNDVMRSSPQSVMEPFRSHPALLTGDAPDRIVSSTPSSRMKPTPSSFAGRFMRTPVVEGMQLAWVTCQSWSASPRTSITKP